MDDDSIQLLPAWSPLIYDLLSYAEGTAELREHVLALDFDQLSKNNFLPIHYLTALRKVVSNSDTQSHFTRSEILMTAQNFGDDGALYRSQLNRHTRHILEHPNKSQSDIMSELQKDHDISAILALIESERAAELVARQRTDETRRDSIELNAQHTHIARDSPEHGGAAAGPISDANAESRHAKFSGGKRAADHEADVEASPRRSLRLRPQMNTSTSSAQPTSEAGISRLGQDRGREKKKRR